MDVLLDTEHWEWIKAGQPVIVSAAVVRDPQHPGCLHSHSLWGGVCFNEHKPANSGDDECTWPLMLSLDCSLWFYLCKFLGGEAALPIRFRKSKWLSAELELEHRLLLKLGALPLCLMWVKCSRALQKWKTTASSHLSHSFWMIKYLTWISHFVSWLCSILLSCFLFLHSFYLWL